LIEHFVAGTMARTAAALVGMNKTTEAYYFHRLRELIYEAEEEHTPFSGEIEVDESYFGGRRKGIRGRGAKGKVPVFGLLKRGGKVYAKVIPDARSATLMPIMQEKILPDSIVYQAKRHMRKFNGIPKEHFHLFLKECEWRFNNPHPKMQLNQLKHLAMDHNGVII
jgi:transposase